MDIITIGDLHGSPAWKDVSFADWDRMVFVGDYVDSFEYDDQHILENLREVIRLKETHPGKVVLLWGNHDLSYLFLSKQGHGCSGFRTGMAQHLHDLFSENRDLFLTAWQTGKYIWTHAGIVREWYEKFIEKKVTGDATLSDTLNRLFREYDPLLFHVGPLRGGCHSHGGVFWADIRETLHDPLPGYHQVFGHTKTGNGVLSYISGDKTTSVTCTDCLETKTEFFQLKLTSV